MAFPSEGALLGIVGEGAPQVVSFYNGNPTRDKDRLIYRSYL